MRILKFDPTWPQEWKYSFPYDQQEVFGRVSSYGYAYAYKNRHSKTVSLLESVLATGNKVLDVAAAQGNFSLILAERGYVVTWNDLRASLEGYVRLKYEYGHMHYASGNVFELTFPEPFDAILITEIIEHVAHPDDFLRKISTLVRPGGYIVMTTPNGAYFKNHLPRFSDCADPSEFEAMQFKPNSDGHIFLLHPDEISSLAERANLHIDRLDLFTTPLTNGHLKTEKLLKILPGGVIQFFEKAAQNLPRSLKEKLLVHMAVLFRKPE